MIPRYLALGFLLFLPTLAVACGSSDSDSDPAPSGTAGSAGAAGSAGGGQGGAAGATGNKCTTLQEAGTEVAAATMGTGEIPTAGGGTITPGTYPLTAVTVFGASALTSDSYWSTWRFDGDSYEYINSQSFWQAGTYSPDGTSDLKLTPACSCQKAVTSDELNCIDSTNTDPAKADLLATRTISYTATDTTFLVFSGYINGGTQQSTFTRH